MPLREPQDYASEFAARLRELGHRAALIGALAAAEYRVDRRFTTDADFLVLRLGELAEQLRSEGYEVKTMAAPGDEPYLAMVRGHGIKVDLLAAETPFQRAALDRARDGIITVEDVIVFKLIAWRPRDRDDIASILHAGHDLDEAYIERWVAEWEVSDRWHDAKRSFV